MRALAAKQITHDQHGNEIAFDLVDAFIEVQHGTDWTQQRRRPFYFVKGCSNITGHFLSLHKAKNAIRRHFNIASRKELRREETVR